MRDIKVSRYKGLTESQVEESRRLHGTNVLTPTEKEPLWKKFLEKFKDPLIIVLLIAGLLSIGISFYEYYGLGEESAVFFEPVGIFFAILLATGLSFWFENNAEKEFAILNQVNDDEPVQVIRGGKARQVPKRDIVVGDIVMLNTGAEIPADGDLLHSVRLHVDESSLTGEPVCHKSADVADFDPQATYPTNRVLRGSKVMEGNGAFVVTAVGDHTENGKVFKAAQIDNGHVTPLSEQLNRLSKLITWLSYAIAACLVVGHLIVYFAGDNPMEWSHIVAYVLKTLMIAVTLIVVAVPEGLPMAVTLSLAYSMRRMLKTNNLVRKLHACETMGAATVICTDKTGTLTQNRMTVGEACFYGLPTDGLGDDEKSRLIAEGIAVNSTALLDDTDDASPKVLGNPTEGALLLWLRQQKVNYERLREAAEVTDQLPFTTELKYMATVVRSSALPGKRVLYVKGAPEIVLSLCQKIDGNKTVTDINNQLSAFQKRAMRVLGFAYQILDDDATAIDANALKADARLTFLGVVAISDPVREDAAAAVAECLNAGIEVKIVTGDNAETAKEIGRQIGLWSDTDGSDAIITGEELESLSEKDLDNRSLRLKIIARARPMDKKRLVESLQRQGQVVAVTGDGTNDAPALKTAHVGLSMGDGTAVAKEASDITIIDNSFASIGRAVMWGRSLYCNIQRFLLFQLTVNVAACLIVLVGAFMGTRSPLGVTQMLWINLIMDTFGAMALASLPPDPSVMTQRPRKRTAFILSPVMMREILLVGCFFFLMLFGFLYFFEHSDIQCMADLLHCQFGPNKGLTDYDQTLLFSIFVWMHFWYMFDARLFGTDKCFCQAGGSKGFWTITAIIVIGQVLIVQVFPRFFECVPMRLDDWLIIIVASSLVLWVREGWHLLYHALTKRSQKARC